MKKVFILVFAAAFLFIGCGDEDPKPATIDDNEEVSDIDDENAADEDAEVVNDEDIVEENDENQTDDVTEEPDETEEPVEPDENNDPVNPGFEVIGTFNLSYTGQINTEVNMQSRGGEGSADFVYNGQAISFGKINIGIDLFPMTMVNSGNIVIVWLDSFGLGDLQGTSNKQVFGISMPQNIEAGSGTLAAANMYAFYGDMTVNITGGQFEIKCVRTVTNVGNYEVIANDGSNLTMNANGDLLDPAAGAAYLPYPACE
ncbi:hypothetical protein J6253_09260 [bacterium]|jgi:hypothetical protein|nr:hypothetical protein [bacterium]MBP5592019.1 hypothetical protein [bacterium]